MACSTRAMSHLGSSSSAAPQPMISRKGSRSSCNSTIRHISISTQLKNQLSTTVQPTARLRPLPSMQSQHGGSTDWRDAVSVADVTDDEAYLTLTEAEVEERIDEAAAMIEVVHDLRPMPAMMGRDGGADKFNACSEVWRRVRRVPPWERHRLLGELEPGAIRGLWKASMSRYVLDDARAMDLANGYSIWQDFPNAPGQVYTYEGKCEQYVFTAPKVRFFVDDAKQSSSPGSTWLKPALDSIDIPVQTFKIHFFSQPSTGELMGRFVFPLWGPLDRWWMPCYLRLKLELVLTPIREDAGADFTFEYPFPSSPDLNGWLGTDMELLHEHLPDPTWPKPHPEESSSGSPLSRSARDYVRVAGPGLLVGCAYRANTNSGASSEGGRHNEEDCVYFALARRTSKADYVRSLEDEVIGAGDDELANQA